MCIIEKEGNMEGKRFLLIGRAGSGKDTVADFMVEHYGFVKLSFAAKLKEIAAEMFPVLWMVDKRRMLQNLGMAFREIEENCWVDYLVRQVHKYPKIVITDCRYGNEYDTCLNSGFIPVKINCDDRIRAERIFKRDGQRMTATEMAHISEQLNVRCDYHLDNDHDLHSLYEQIERMVQDADSNKVTA